MLSLVINFFIIVHNYYVMFVCKNVGVFCPKRID